VASTVNASRPGGWRRFHNLGAGPVREQPIGAQPETPVHG